MTMRDRPESIPQFPRVPLWRRGVATAIDAVLVGLLSGLLGPGFELPLFGVLWLVLRVLMVANNRGQSIGRLAMDIKLVDPRSRRIPTPIELTKRELIVGAEAWLALQGLGLLSQVNPVALLCLAPAIVDGLVTTTDENRQQQSFHDRLVGTIVVQTRRGFSLDLKVQRWYRTLRDQTERFMRR